MTDYFANGDLAAYASLLRNYDAERQAWDASRTLADDAYTAALASYDLAHAAWVDDPLGADGLPMPEPMPPDAPVYPPTPVAPDVPSVVYSAQLADAQTTIDTSTGPALVLPGRYIMSGGGASFALNAAELAASYTDTSEPLPQAKR